MNEARSGNKDVILGQLKEMYKYYSDAIMDINLKRFQKEAVDEMAFSWVSINGCKAVNKAVIQLNENLEYITKQLEGAFASINRAMYEVFSQTGDQGFKYDFEPIYNRFNSENAAETINGGFMVFDENLKKVSNKFRDYQACIENCMNEIKLKALNLDLQGYTDFKYSVAERLDNVKIDIKNRIEAITEDIDTIINTETTDAIEAKTNAKRYMQETGNSSLR